MSLSVCPGSKTDKIVVEAVLKQYFYVVDAEFEKIDFGFMSLDHPYRGFNGLCRRYVPVEIVYINSECYSARRE